MTDRPSSHELVLERTLAASPERVFRAGTDPGELTRLVAFAREELGARHAVA
jgi:uncharacterized protein YndB with AHSA1/START domain